MNFWKWEILRSAKRDDLSKFLWGLLDFRDDFRPNAGKNKWLLRLRICRESQTSKINNSQGITIGLSEKWKFKHDYFIKNMTWTGTSSGFRVSWHGMSLPHLIHTISTYIRAGAVGTHQSFHLWGLTEGIHKGQFGKNVSSIWYAMISSESKTTLESTVHCGL